MAFRARKVFCTFEKRARPRAVKVNAPCFVLHLWTQRGKDGGIRLHYELQLRSVSKEKLKESRKGNLSKLKQQRTAKIHPRLFNFNRAFMEDWERNRIGRE